MPAGRGTRSSTTRRSRSIGAIAVAPSDPRIIYVGSGEADMRSDIAYGNGMYKSTDGGKTWIAYRTRAIRDRSARSSSIRAIPTSSYVAALGHPYGPNAERGVFKTTDGGETGARCSTRMPTPARSRSRWNPANPNVLYAALWQTRRPPWNVYPPSNGPGSGLYKSDRRRRDLDAA